MPHSVQTTSGNHTADERDLSTRYWNSNRCRELWTEECPDFLAGASQKDIGLLSKKDEEFERFSWTQVRDIVETRQIQRFQRPSSRLRAYLEYVYHLKKRYGSISEYLQHQRLRWEELTPTGDPPFTNAADFKILYNDWPYYIDEDITHLVVWTKFPIEEDEVSGEVTESANADLENFITKTFCTDGNRPGSSMRREQIIWFRNWKSLKSVHALEHFHVMLYQAPAALLEAVTDGDRPMADRELDRLGEE